MFSPLGQVLRSKTEEIREQSEEQRQLTHLQRKPAVVVNIEEVEGHLHALRVARQEPAQHQLLHALELAVALLLEVHVHRTEQSRVDEWMSVGVVSAVSAGASVLGSAPVSATWRRRDERRRGRLT